MSKKLLNAFIFLVGLVLILPSIVNAADFTFYSLKNTYTEGETFSVDVKIEPKEKTIYTTKVQINYPADLLKIQSFSFAENWLPLTQAGYDLIDNTNGILIKTAGYPGGISSVKTLGTISFYAKKSGSATIEIDKDSMLLDANNQNVFSATEAKLILTLKEKALVKPIKEREEAIKEPTEELEEPIPPETEEREKIVKEITPKIPPIEEAEVKTGLMASLGMAIRGISQSVFLTIVVILCLIGLIVIGIREWQLFKKKKRE